MRKIATGFEGHWNHFGNPVQGGGPIEDASPSSVPAEEYQHRDAICDYPHVVMDSLFPNMFDYMCMFNEDLYTDIPEDVRYQDTGLSPTTGEVNSYSIGEFIYTDQARTPGRPNDGVEGSGVYRVGYQQQYSQSDFDTENLTQYDESLTGTNRTGLDNRCVMKLNVDNEMSTEGFSITYFHRALFPRTNSQVYRIMSTHDFDFCVFFPTTSIGFAQIRYRTIPTGTGAALYRDRLGIDGTIDAKSYGISPGPVIKQWSLNRNLGGKDLYVPIYLKVEPPKGSNPAKIIFSFYGREGSLYASDIGDLTALEGDGFLTPPNMSATALHGIRLYMVGNDKDYAPPMYYIDPEGTIPTPRNSASLRGFNFYDDLAVNSLYGSDPYANDFAPYIRGITISGGYTKRGEITAGTWLPNYTADFTGTTPLPPGFDAFDAINDAEAETFAETFHPGVLGQRLRTSWAEIFPGAQPPVHGINLTTKGLFVPIQGNLRANLLLWNNYNTNVSLSESKYGIVTVPDGVGNIFPGGLTQGYSDVDGSSNPNTFTVVGGSGKGLEVSVSILMENLVTRAYIVDGGDDYDLDEIVTLDGSAQTYPSATTATARVVLLDPANGPIKEPNPVAGDYIKGVSIHTSGTGYSTGAATIAGGSGTGLAINITDVDIDEDGAGPDTADGYIIDFDITNPGSGYVVGDIVTVDQGGNTTAQLRVTQLSATTGPIMALEIIDRGTDGDYEQAAIDGTPIDVISAGAGTGAKAVILTTEGSVNSVNVINGGEGYQIGDTLTIIDDYTGANDATFEVTSVDDIVVPYAYDSARSSMHFKEIRNEGVSFLTDKRGGTYSRDALDDLEIQLEVYNS